MTYLSMNPDAYIAHVTREFDVREERLQRRYAESNSKSSRPAAGKALSNEIEASICEYIEQLDSFDISIRLLIL